MFVKVSDLDSDALRPLNTAHLLQVVFAVASLVLWEFTLRSFWRFMDVFFWRIVGYETVKHSRAVRATLFPEAEEF